VASGERTRRAEEEAYHHYTVAVSPCTSRISFLRMEEDEDDSSTVSLLEKGTRVRFPNDDGGWTFTE